METWNINSEKRRICQICGRDQLSTLHPGVLVRPVLAELIQAEVGRWSEDGWICSEDLQKFRHKYVQSLLEAEKGELTVLDKEVLESLRQQEILSRNPDEELQTTLTQGQRLADRIATVGGSWKFIICFVVILVVWIAINSLALFSRPFETFPRSLTSTRIDAVKWRRFHMTKNQLFFISLFLVMFMVGAAWADDLQPIQLLSPQIDGGKPLMQALQKRSTSREFSSDQLPDQVLSNLLWAAYGINRPESGSGELMIPSVSLSRRDKLGVSCRVKVPVVRRCSNAIRDYRFVQTGIMRQPK